MATIQETIAEALKGLSPRVESEVVARIADRTVDKNVDILVKCVDLLTAEEAALKKLERPDNVQFDKDGKSVSETYSKTRWDEVKKKRERIEKIKKAINKALENSDYVDAINLSGGKASAEDKTGDGEKDDTSTAG